MITKIRQRLTFQENKLLDMRCKEGQSLVEIAIFAPLLIFMLIGVFEVGYALRSYLTLVNVNREITRFAVRPGYLNFSILTDPKTEPPLRVKDYDRVLEWANSSVGGQLDLDFDKTDGETSLLVSHLVVNTGLPCEDILSKPKQCDCNWFDPDHADYDPDNNKVFTKDDIIVHPGIDGQEFQAALYGPSSTVTGSRATRLDYEALAQQLKDQNNKFNCEVLKKGGVTSENNVVVTEMFHDQPQLFGFPFVSNPFTDPVPLYTHTTMRLIGAARSTGGVEGNITKNIDTIGPVCFAYPFTIHEDDLSGAVENVTQLDILGGKTSGTNDRGFLAWDPQDDAEEDLEYELQYPQLSSNGYKNPVKLADTALNIGDWVASLPGNNGGVNSPPDTYYIDNLAGQDIIIPVYDKLEAVNSMQSYHIVDFITVRIMNGTTKLTSNNPEVTALYRGPAPEACTGGP